MTLKTYSGNTMAEALAKVKSELGPDAVILNTRSLPRSKWLGVGGQAKVEITATRHMSDLPQTPKRGKVGVSAGRLDSANGWPTMTTSSRTSPSATISPALSDELLSQMRALRSAVGDLTRASRSDRTESLPGELFATYRKLVENSVSDDIAQRIVERGRSTLTAQQLADPAAVRTFLSKEIEGMLPTAGAINLQRDGGPTIIALVGATGVGKTTTIAKLAANFCLRGKRRVGLITIDTYRIAAVEQLKTYADIIAVPLEVVVSPEALREAVTRLHGCDVILIDTAGRSQRDAAKIEELLRFFQVVRPHEVHLVLSATCGESVLLQTVRQFRPVGVDRVIFTKLDEAIGFGVMLACLEKAKAKLSYVTTGQDVPDDIRVGDRRALARLIVSERAAESLLETPCVEASCVGAA